MLQMYIISTSSGKHVFLLKNVFCSALIVAHLIMEITLFDE